MATEYVTLANVSGEDIYPVTDLAAINMTVTNGIAVVQTNGGTIGIRDGYIESSYFTNMTSQGIGAATIGETYIEGGTMFQLIGGYMVTDEIPPITGASHERVPSEYSVRSAIDALATLGPSLAPGAGIVVETVPGSTGGTIAVAPGDGINVNTAQTGGVSVKAATSGGLSVTSAGVAVNVGAGLGIDGSNTVNVAAKTSGGLTVDTTGVGIVAGDTLDLTGGTVNAKVAAVDEVLTSLVTGSTVRDDVEEVTPGNLRGALSVGQAVDVSCAPACQGVVYSYSTDGTNWVSLGDFKATNGFLGDFYVRLVNGTAGSEAAYFGFHPAITGGKFPKAATGLKYLVVCDVCNMGASIYNPAGFVVNGSSIISYSRVPEDARRAEQTTYTRVAGIMTDNGRAYFAFAPDAANTTIILHIKNWRQYEVTNLTDEAIQYLASATTNPNPDAFFRSTSAYSVRDKYLIKQDMVCPFIPTINMPDNSAGLTIGAGLSYQIKYTKTGTYSVSVDTIPADAYGWDAHISMFVKDTAIVQFKAPLILMDALTPNAGHNLSVKFRNGNALVYVDDTNAGTMVYLTTGTTTTQGSLPYALSQTPPSEDATFTNFVVFSPVLGGTVCSMGTMSNVAYSASLIGNSDDETIIGGTIGLASGKYLAVQDINLNDVEITSGTLNIGNNVKVNGTTTNGVVGSGTGAIVLDESCLLDFSDQTNNVPITGISISVVSGARAIPYGGTESEAISVGTGNAVTKYGKCGYLVSDASGTTASNTLYDALVGGGTPYSNVVFDPALDGQTVSVPGGAYGTGSGADYYKANGNRIYGNGQANTILTVAQTSAKQYFKVDGGAIYLYDMTVSATTRFSPGTYQNCKFTGSPWSADLGAVFIGSNSAQITTLTDCSFTDVVTSLSNNWNLMAINVNASVHATNVTVTGCTIFKGFVLSGTPAYLGDSLFDHVVFSGNQFGNGMGAICASYSSGTWGVFKATIKDCSFLDTTASIRIGGAESIVTFSGTNIINSTVSGAGTVAFADGATVTSTPVAEGELGTGVISANFNSRFPTNTSFSNVTISGCTTPIALIDVLINRTVSLNNCVITGNTSTGASAQYDEQWYALMNYYGYAHLTNVVISGNTGSSASITANMNSIYAYGGDTYVTGTTCRNLVAYRPRVVILDGENKYNSLQWVYDIGSGSIVFTPGSTTSVAAMSSLDTARGTGTFYVGTYDPSNQSITTEGTATVILSGNTITISGSGTTIDSTGLHS